MKSTIRLHEALEKLEKQMGKKLGGVDDPLLLSVRSGAKFSMPGMMNTILNLGLNDETTEGLAKKTGNPRFAYDCYRRFIQMFGEVALHIDMEKFDHIFDARKAKIKAKLDTDLTADDLQSRSLPTTRSWSRKKPARSFRRTRSQQLTDVARRGVQFLEHAEGHLLPADGKDSGFHRHRRQRAGHGIRQHGRQLRHRASASRAIPQRARRSSTASFWSTRRAKTWSPVFARRSRSPSSSRSCRRPTTQLREITSNLEKHYRDVQDFEFTIEEGKLYMLQTRNGKRTGPAAVRIAVDMVEEGLIIEERSGAARRAESA